MLNIKLLNFFKINHHLENFFNNLKKNIVIMLLLLIFFFLINFTFILIKLNFLIIIKNFYYNSIYNLKFDLFGFILFILSILTGTISILLSDNKIIKNKYILIFNYLIFFIILLCFFFCNNIILFFILYEFLMLPSVILVFLSSPNLRSRSISFYFILWTQLGSFLVLIANIIIINNYNILLISDMGKVRQVSYIKTVSLLLFFGFGIKIPIWPFHFWLTKTHVEANTAFSIFLSGILVKTALFGMYKYIYLIVHNFSILYLLIILVGLLDSVLKIWSQMDFKKIVAYCTIFEMNLILLNLLLFSYHSVGFIIYFSCLHTILSGLFFYISDLIYKRYNSRSILSVNNIINYYPMLAFNIIISVIIFNGLPLTLKFNLEVLMLLKVYNFSRTVFTLLFLINIILVIFISKIFFYMIFSTIINKKIKNDLSTNEILFFIFFYFIIIVMSLA